MNIEKNIYKSNSLSFKDYEKWTAFNIWEYDKAK
jgi:hypothetical protein